MQPLSKKKAVISGKTEDNNAMIAQLVEHDLAKVGVASSSLVHRSENCRFILLFFSETPLCEEESGNTKRAQGAPVILLLSLAGYQAQVAELVDAYVSGAYAARCAGSSPVLGTEKTPAGIQWGPRKFFNLWGERRHRSPQ